MCVYLVDPSLLFTLQMYKRHDPSSVEEIEFMENLFNSLCTALMLPANRERFLRGEGIQLMNLMLRFLHLSSYVSVTSCIVFADTHMSH